MDNLLDSLAFVIKKECPDKISNVEFRTLRDKRKMTPLGPIIDGQPKAFVDAIKMLDSWKYKNGDEEVNLGVPATWGSDTILVLDSLSRFCDAAYDFNESIIPRGNSGTYDGRAVYGNAQDAVENVLASLTSPGFRTNVIVICHGVYMQQPDGVEKIFPQGVGQKLSPKIPQYFPSYVRYTFSNGKRTIQLKSDINISLATPKPIEKATLPAETGLAELFAELRGAVPRRA